MNKYWKTFLTIVITAAICITAFNVYLSVKINPIIKSNELSEKIQAIDKVISENGICDFNKQDAIDNALRYYVFTLEDNYCEYFTESDYQEFLNSNAGNFTGIGVAVYTQSDKIENGLIVKRVLGNSPAEEADIRPTDVIIAVNSESIIGTKYEDAINKILGEKNTSVTLTIQRENETKDITVIRQSFLQREIDYKVIEKNIGFIRIHEFNTNAFSEFKTAVTTLLSLGVKGFIFDVRNNPGGELNTVINMLNLLVPEDELVIIQEKNNEEVYKSSGARLTDLPMCVLINESSASASELFSSALRDLNKSFLIGEKSFGKGVGQTTYSLYDNSAIKLTTFNYVTKSRINYNGIGLVPDIEVIMNEEDNKRFYLLNETNDNQLIAAINYIKSIIE